MRVFKLYFLVLLLAFLPMVAKDVADQKGGKTVKAEQPESIVDSDEAKEESEKTIKYKKDGEPKKFNASITNAFSHGLAKERKSFNYALNFGASYQLPWKIDMSAGIGFNATYSYSLDSAYTYEDGTVSAEKIRYGTFDGTPLNIGFSRVFALIWGINSVAGIDFSFPFTSVGFWNQYNIYTMLSISAGLSRGFKIAKKTSVTAGLSLSYTKTFAKEAYSWDSYQNDVMSPITEHSFVPKAKLSFKYKDLGISIGGRLDIGRYYSSNSYNYIDGTKSFTQHQEWQTTFSFVFSTDYSIKDWDFTLGVATNAPDKESGNYRGYSRVAGDPEVDNPSENYPFKGKYTKIFTNIVYRFSF